MATNDSLDANKAAEELTRKLVAALGFMTVLEPGEEYLIIRQAQWVCIKRPKMPLEVAVGAAVWRAAQFRELRHVTQQTIADLLHCQPSSIARACQRLQPLFKDFFEHNCFSVSWNGATKIFAVGASLNNIFDSFKADREYVPVEVGFADAVISGFLPGRAYKLLRPKLSKPVKIDTSEELDGFDDAKVRLLKKFDDPPGTRLAPQSPRVINRSTMHNGVRHRSLIAQEFVL